MIRCLNCQKRAAGQCRGRRDGLGVTTAFQGIIETICWGEQRAGVQPQPRQFKQSESESECKCLTCNQKPTASQFSYCTNQTKGLMGKKLKMTC